DGCIATEYGGVPSLGTDIDTNRNSLDSVGSCFDAKRHTPGFASRSARANGYRICARSATVVTVSGIRGVNTEGRSDQLMHTAMQSFNSSGPSPFSLIFGSCRSPFLHQAGHSGPMALNQAHYARKSNLFRARSDFFAMTRFTSAQDTNK